MTVGCEIESPVERELDRAYRKVNRLLRRTETDMNVGLALIDNQRTFESDLENLVETLMEYTNCRIHELRLTESPLTDIRLETRIYTVRTAFEGVLNMTIRLIESVRSLRETADPTFDTASVMCLIKAETVMDEIRDILARQEGPALPESPVFYQSDWR